MRKVNTLMEIITKVSCQQSIDKEYPDSSDLPVQIHHKAKNNLFQGCQTLEFLRQVTQVEKDIDRIQTLIKKTIYFNLFRAHLISYFILILAFICISVYIYIYIYICMYIYTHVYIGNLVLTTEMKT